jgi:hypothetical protein
MNDADMKLIHETVIEYFIGTFVGDTKKLKGAFHPDARITGNLNGQLQNWSLNEFINRVTTSPTAETSGEEYHKEILFVDGTNEAAMVKARVIEKGLTFIDYITLLKIDGNWVIRNKSFTA